MYVCQVYVSVVEQVNGHAGGCWDLCEVHVRCEGHVVSVYVVQPECGYTRDASARVTSDIRQMCGKHDLAPCHHSPHPLECLVSVVGRNPCSSPVAKYMHMCYWYSVM